MRFAPAFFAALLLALYAAATVDAAEHTSDSLKVVRKNLTEKKAVLLDVRELGEWNSGHLLKAELFSLSKIRGGEAPRKHKKKIIYCHCRSGGRTLIAADLLRAKGYDIRPLKDGYHALLKAGFKKAPVKK